MEPRFVGKFRIRLELSQSRWQASQDLSSYSKATSIEPKACQLSRQAQKAAGGALRIVLDFGRSKTKSLVEWRGCRIGDNLFPRVLREARGQISETRGQKIDEFISFRQRPGHRERSEPRRKPERRVEASCVRPMRRIRVRWEGQIDVRCRSLDCTAAPHDDVRGGQDTARGVEP